MVDANVRNELCNFILLQLNYARRDFCTSEIAAHLDRREKCLLSKELARLLSDGQLSRTGKERYHITGGIASFRRYLLSCTERESPTALEMPEDHLSLDDIMRATWHMVDLPKELSTIESDDDDDGDDDDIDWLLAEDTELSEAEVNPKAFEFPTPQAPEETFQEWHEEDGIPPHDLWTDQTEFEEAVMEILENIVRLDLDMTRMEAASHAMCQMKKAANARTAQVCLRAWYELIIVSDEEYQAFREAVRRG